MNFRQINGMSLADYHKEFEMLVKVSYEAGADFVTMKRMERKRKRLYSLIPIGHLTERQKGIIHKKIRERYMAIAFVMNSNQNKYEQYKEDCNNNYNNQNDHRWPASLSEAYGKLKIYKFNLEYYKAPNTPITDICGNA